MDYRIDKIVSTIEKIAKGVNIFDYVNYPKNIVAAYGSKLYSTSTGVEYSNDYGKSWTKIVDVPTFIEMHITRNNIVYGFSTSGSTIKLHRSTDFITFTEVDLTEFGNIRPIRAYGYDSNGNTFVFAEKNNSLAPESPVARLFTTSDGGITFNVSLSVETGVGDITKIGHFHNVSYIGGATMYDEPYTWIATTGDHNNNIKWFISRDNALTWDEIEGLGNQVYRTLWVDRTADNYVIWATDALPPQLGGIYRAKLDDIVNTTELVHPLYSVAFASRVRAKGICVTVGEGATSNRTVYIYASKDGGKTWQVEKELSVASESTHAQPGFHRLVGPDGQGNYYIEGVAMQDAKHVKVVNRHNTLDA